MAAKRKKINFQNGQKMRPSWDPKEGIFAKFIFLCDAHF